MFGVNERYGRDCGNREYCNRDYSNRDYSSRDYNGRDYQRNRVGSARGGDDTYLIAEINRIKGETNELRRLLEERSIQVDNLEKAMEHGNTETLAMIQKLSVSLDKLSEQLEEAEVAITDSIDQNQEGIGESVAAATKPFEEKLKKVTESLSLTVSDLKKDMVKQGNKVDEAKAAVEGLEELLEEKAEKKSVIAIHQRITTMFAVGIANLVGTVMVVAVLCYLILSLVR